MTTSGRSFSHLPLFAFIIVFCLPISVLIVQAPFLVGTAVVVAIAIFFISFVSTEAGLYILVFSMLLSPEISVGGLGTSATAKRGITLRAEDFILVLLSFAWLMRMAVYKVGLVRGTTLNRPIAYYVVTCLFATGVGLITGHVKGLTGFFFVLKYVEYFFVYFIVVNNVHTRAQIQRFAVALLLTGLIISLIALAQIPAGGRVSTPFEGDQGEPNTLGGYLLFVGAIAAGLSLQIEQRTMRYALRCLILVMVFPFLFTLSRGSYLALPFVFLTLMLLRQGKRGGMILFLAGLVVIGSVAMPRTIVDRITGTFEGSRYAKTEVVGGVRLDPSASARITNWKNVAEDVMESPIWGFGVTGYGFVDAQYPRIVAETGIVGIAIFCFLIYRVFLTALVVYRHDGDGLVKGLSMGLIAGLVGLLVHGVGANTFTIVRIMEPFWLTVGLVTCAGELQKSRDAERVDLSAIPD